MKIVLKGNKAVYTLLAVALATILIVLSIVHPATLARNTFLANFVSHEIMAFMVVPLTITFASVSHIHLQISNMIRALETPEARRRMEQRAVPLRAEINSSAWLLFWSFVTCAVALIVKGSFSEVEYVVSLVHAVAIVVVAVNSIVLYDVHKTIFALAPHFTPEAPNAGQTESQGRSRDGEA
jgi:hypothetical protein